jgi:two-component system sensor histidine kinase PilS (NtrC family)
MRARILIATVLLVLQVYLFNHSPMSVLLLLVNLAYLGIAMASLGWTRPSPSASAWSAGWAKSVWIDLAVFTALQALQPDNGMALTPLFFFPVLLAAILGSLLLALGTAACATLSLLSMAWWHSLQNPGLQASVYVQAGIAGAGLFAVAALGNQLAQRLLREQSAAQHSHWLASLEASVNSLIVAGLKEGVVVLAPDGSIWHANHAARGMLGAEEAPTHTSMADAPGWLALQHWLSQRPSGEQETRGEVSLPIPDGGQRRLRIRMQTAASPAEIPACQVLFLEDQRDFETRLQNEKLAAMGRISAAVAHEIRNPLAAIIQANALLEEDPLLPAQAKLTNMIRHSAHRLAHTVDDILNLVQIQPVEADAGNTPVLDPQVRQVVLEWQGQHPQGMRLGMWLQAGPHRVLFEPEHLRRVLINLLDNADRHADRSAMSIRIRSQIVMSSGKSELQLSVWSLGPPMDEHVKTHLFEPFVTSGSRSSGLGLYICQELCQRYRATLHYIRQDDQGMTGNAFHITMPIFQPHALR